METIQIISKESMMSGSMFGPKQVVVYRLPTIDDCMGILPKSLGNYILSYTYAWVEFYLDNLVEKFGHYFVNMTLSSLNVKGKSKYNQQELYKHTIQYIRENNVSKNLIRDKFKIAIAKRIREIFLEDQKKERILLKRQIDLERLQVGTIFRGENTVSSTVVFLVIQKTAKQYYSIKIIIENETETYYFIKFLNQHRSPTVNNIILNEPILEVENPIKPTKKLMIKNHNQQYTEALFNEKTKKMYFLELFR
jgi:hypothetical protein